MCVEPAPEANVHHSKSKTQNFAARSGIHSTETVGAVGYEQLKSDPSTYVAKREKRKDDSILLRHVDDVVGAGTEEHLMRDFERMKTILLLTDVVVLRNTGDTVNLLGLEIIKTTRGLEVKNSHELEDFLLSVYAKPAATRGRRVTVNELASAIPLQGRDSTYRTAVGKPTHMFPWGPDMQFAFQQVSTPVREPMAESRRVMKQLLRFLRGANNTCLRLEPHAMMREDTIELAGRSDSD